MPQRGEVCPVSAAHPQSPFLPSLKAGLMRGRPTVCWPAIPSAVPKLASPLRNIGSVFVFMDFFSSILLFPDFFLGGLAAFSLVHLHDLSGEEQILLTFHFLCPVPSPPTSLVTARATEPERSFYDSLLNIVGLSG